MCVGVPKGDWMKIQSSGMVPCVVTYAVYDVSKALRPFEASAVTYPTTQPEDLNIQQQCVASDLECR